MGSRGSSGRAGFGARIRPPAVVSFILLIGLAASAATVASPTSPEDVWNQLNRTLMWYERVEALDQSAYNPTNAAYRDELQRDSVDVVQLGFQYAKAQAAILAASGQGISAPTTASTAQTNLQNAMDRVAQARGEIDGIDHQLAGAAAAASRPTLQARREELQSELNLATERRDLLQDLVQFMNGPGNGAGGLMEKINALERSSAATQSSSAGDAQAFHADSAGILGLVTQMFSLTRKLNDVQQLADRTEKLSEANKSLRAPLTEQLRAAIKESPTMAGSDDIATLAAQRHHLDEAAARYKQIACAFVPLREQGVRLDSIGANLKQWQGSLDRQYGFVLHFLVLRLGIMLGAVLILLAISHIWKRATFRYVSDVRRRRQFLVVRRIVVGSIIIIIISAGVMTEFGSIVTFAGLLTAGIAVALQSVILSGFAYFFFIGRYGIRTGDRITVSGITGDVLDIGLFRIYMMELGGLGRDLHPTGRIVVFSNSVVFQGTAFFKQIPGTDYIWHEVSLLLSPDTDTALAERLLMGAVNSIYDEYRELIQEQQQKVNKMFHLEIKPPKPEGRLRFLDAGLEFIVRYPVLVRRSAEIDELVNRALLETINKEAKLQLSATTGNGIILGARN